MLCLHKNSLKIQADRSVRKASRRAPAGKLKEYSAFAGYSEVTPAMFALFLRVTSSKNSGNAFYTFPPQLYSAVFSFFFFTRTLIFLYPKYPPAPTTGIIINQVHTGRNINLVESSPVLFNTYDTGPFE